VVPNLLLADPLRCEKQFWEFTDKNLMAHLDKYSGNIGDGVCKVGK
jgi:hypothetical protein